MKLRKFLSLLLCLCMVMTLLPATALAVDATINYLDITVDSEGNPTGCVYKGATDTDIEGILGILISGGTYTLAGNYDGAIIVVNDAAVTYDANIDLSSVGNEIFIFGSGSLIANNVTVTAGSYTSGYEGADGNSLLSFIGGLPEGTFYSYNVTANTVLVDILTVYDLTIQSGNTLTINAPSDDAHDYYRLTVTHALNVSGTLTAAEGQTLEIGENATVSGLTLYEDNGTDEYTFAPTHFPETFVYTNVAAQEQPAVWRWVRQNAGGGEPQNDPTYRVRWDWNALEVKLGAESFDDQNEGQELNYPATGGGGLVFTFKAKAAQGDGPANMFYGLKVTEVGDTPTVTYIKAATLTGNATDGYTYTIPEENFDKSIEIEAISWATPFDNEFIVFYDNPDGSAGVSYTGGSVTEASLNDLVVTEFAADTAYTFTLTPPTGVEAPHKVQIEPND